MIAYRIDKYGQLWAKENQNCIGSIAVDMTDFKVTVSASLPLAETRTTDVVQVIYPSRYSDSESLVADIETAVREVETVLIDHTNIRFGRYREQISDPSDLVGEQLRAGA